jgi:hypothetical protein
MPYFFFSISVQAILKNKQKMRADRLPKGKIRQKKMAE